MGPPPELEWSGESPRVSLGHQGAAPAVETPFPPPPTLQPLWVQVCGLLVSEAPSPPPKPPASPPLTVDELLLLGRDDAAQMCLLCPAPALGIHPALTLGEVAVTVALELGPALLTQLLVCNTGQGREDGGPEAAWGCPVWPVSCQRPTFTPTSMSVREGRGPFRRGSRWEPGRPGPGAPEALGMFPSFLSVMCPPPSFSLVVTCSGGC